MNSPANLGDLLVQLTRIADALERAAPAASVAKSTPPPETLAPMVDDWVAWNGRRPILSPGTEHDIIQRNGTVLHNVSYRNAHETHWLWWSRAAKGTLRPTDVIAARFRFWKTVAH